MREQISLKVAGAAEAACALPLRRSALFGRARRSISLGVVLAGWDQDRTVTSLELLQHYLGSLPGVDCRLAVVANNQDDAPPSGGEMILG